MVLGGKDELPLVDNCVFHASDPGRAQSISDLVTAEKVESGQLADGFDPGKLRYRRGDRREDRDFSAWAGDPDEFVDDGQRVGDQVERGEAGHRVESTVPEREVVRVASDVRGSRKRLRYRLREHGAGKVDADAASVACQVVVGVGVNLQLPETVKQQITQPVTDLYTICNSAVDRQQITAAIISELITLLSNYEKTGFSQWQNDWLRYDAFNNKPVLVSGLEKPLQGIARGVDEHGNLLLDVEGEMVKIYGGEVSLRQIVSY